MEKPIHRGRHRVDVENAIIRKREKQFNHDVLWTGTKNYFQHWQKANSKFEQWTSPRYYEDNNKLMHAVKEKRDKEEGLEKRREKLRKLLKDEQTSYEVEIMVHKNKLLLDKPSNSKSEDIPTEILKEVNDEFKIREEERRRHEAEMKLYHQWRINNPIVKQYESKFRSRDLKFSWLDQQIEKRMQKEKEEEENRQFLKERDDQLKKDKEKEEAFQRYLVEKREQLRKNLDAQMEDLKNRQILAEELKKEELEEMRKQSLLDEFVKKQIMEEKRRAERECALFNIQQHKILLKQKALHIQENLKYDELLIARLKELELEKILMDDLKRDELKRGLREFHTLIKEQQELEKQRQRHLEFIFDSEARSVLQKQNELWQQEERARKKLFQNVLKTVKEQVDYNINKNKERQKQVLLEREEMTNKIEEYNKEMQKLREEEDFNKRQIKIGLDEDIKVKNARKKNEENIKMKEINDELDRIRKEEERLKKEILRIQRNQVPRRYSHSYRF